MLGLVLSSRISFRKEFGQIDIFDRMHTLEATWAQLVGRYSNDPKLPNELWIEIEKAYTQRSRHYHNLDHLKAMIDLASTFRASLVDFDIIQFSIFYHDIVYRVSRTDNELKSAKVAEQRLTQLAISPDRIARCYQQILSTKNHEPNEDPDTAYLIDFDLAILAADKVSYRDYAARIRKEYARYPDFLYNPGRKKALQHFLAKDRIFQTEAFFKSAERDARSNLDAELNDL